MDAYKNNIINHLDESDKDKIFFFAEVLFNQSKYRNLRDEISHRRKEIQENKVILHQDFWQDL
jgi:BioD-like phosphotransacetylase family protein